MYRQKLSGVILLVMVFTIGIAEANVRSGYVAANGMQMYHERSGEGYPLVMLHGAYMNIPQWARSFPHIQKETADAQSHFRYQHHP